MLIEGVQGSNYKQCSPNELMNSNVLTSRKTFDKMSVEEQIGGFSVGKNTGGRSTNQSPALPILGELEKQLFRLQNFFLPYPQFTVKTLNRRYGKKELPLKIELKSSNSKSIFGNYSDKYYIKVYGPLLNDSKYPGVERLVLKIARSYAKQARKETEIDEESFLQSSSEYQELLELSDTLKEKEHAQQLEKAKGINTKALCDLWTSIRMQYFPDREDLDDYKVVWSGRRQTSSLASCNVERKRVQVAAAMKRPESIPFLEPLLYHEMCHAFLGQPKIVNGRRIMHGKDFKDLEKKHPGIAELDQWIKAGGWKDAVQQEDQEQEQ